MNTASRSIAKRRWWAVERDAIRATPLPEHQRNAPIYAQLCVEAGFDPLAELCAPVPAPQSAPR